MTDATPETAYAAEFYQRRDHNTRASAAAVVACVQELGPFQSVIDVGCGVGTWLAAFRATIQRP